MFSIIIPLYNKAEYIKQTINSVLQQTFQEFEIIVVDDSSTDNSVEVVSSIIDSRISVYSKPNQGVSAARNYGIRKAKFEYICFLDADDIWNSEYLSTVESLIRNFPQAGMYCVGHSYFNEKIDNITKKFDLTWYNKKNNFLVDDYFKISCLNRCSICLTSAVSVKKSVLLSLNEMFPIGISCGEDVDLWTRIALQYPIAYSNKRQMLYRYSSNNSLYMTFSHSRNSSFQYEKWFSYKSKSPYFHRYINMYLLYWAQQTYANGSIKNSLKILHGCKGIDFSWVSLERIKLSIKCFIKRFKLHD